MAIDGKPHAEHNYTEAKEVFVQQKNRKKAYNE